MTTRTIALFVATLAMGSALPLATSDSLQAFLPSRASTLLGTKDSGKAIELHRAASNRNRYDFHQAMRIYNLYLQKGLQAILKPDINVRSTIDFYLKNPTDDYVPTAQNSTTDPLSTSDYVGAPKDVTSSGALTDVERTTLNRYVKIGRCWQHKEFTKGFYELCLKLIEGKTPSRTTGLQTDLIKSRTTGREYLKGSSASSRITAPTTVKGYDYATSSRAPRARRGASSSASK